MSVPKINSVPSEAIAAEVKAAATGQTQTGLSSVGSSISSAATSSADDEHWIVSWFFGPFRAIGNFIATASSNATSYFGSFFTTAETDAVRIAFIQNNLSALTGDVYEEALDKFSHISDAKARLGMFKQIQNSTTISALTTRAFYDHLPVDMQNHLERHIWIENGKKDDGQGMLYGKNVVNNDIKAELVKKAIDKCLTEG